MFGLPRCVALFTFAVVDGVDDRPENPGHYQKQMEGKQKDAENGRGVHHGHLHQSRKPSSSSVAKSDTSLVLLPRQPLLLHQRVLGRVKQILPRFP